MNKQVFTPRWKKLLATVDYAFQPIVNIYTGKAFAFEALIRNYKEAGFESIDAVFDKAYEENMLFDLDLELRLIAIQKFLTIPFYKELKIFYNVDNRIISKRQFVMGATKRKLRELHLDIHCGNICFELSEKSKDESPVITQQKKVINIYKAQNYKVAIDDFGAGYSGLKMLYNVEPHFLKIDRFFISNIQNDLKKQIFIKSIIEIAQTMGTTVIAEGVETKEEFLVCKKLGCTLAQGYYIQKPQQEPHRLLQEYQEIKNLQKKSRREPKDDKKSLKNTIEKTTPFYADTSITKVLETFKNNKRLNIIPIIGHDNTPLGIIKESTLKDYIYSPYGWSLLENSTRKNILAFVTPCSIVDIHDNLDKILKIYTLKQDNEGVIVTKNSAYYGFLSAKELLKLVSAKNLLVARDQNPLTKLSGNIIINEFIASMINSSKAFAIVYFDLDNFKAFNDYYGFRNGDRVIKLFGEIAQKANQTLTTKSLVGHIGGDDFFLGWEVENENCFEKYYIFISEITRKFAINVESFYNKEDRERRYIISKNRKGEEEKFDLMSVSSGMLMIRNGLKDNVTMDTLGEICAKLKKNAKNSGGNTVIPASYFRKQPMLSCC